MTEMDAQTSAHKESFARILTTFMTPTPSGKEVWGCLSGAAPATLPQVKVSRSNLGSRALEDKVRDSASGDFRYALRPEPVAAAWRPSPPGNAGVGNGRRHEILPLLYVRRHTLSRFFRGERRLCGPAAAGSERLDGDAGLRSGSRRQRGEGEEKRLPDASFAPRKGSLRDRLRRPARSSVPRKWRSRQPDRGLAPPGTLRGDLPPGGSRLRPRGRGTRAPGLSLVLRGAGLPLRRALAPDPAGARRWVSRDRESPFGTREGPAHAITSRLPSVRAAQPSGSEPMPRLRREARSPRRARARARWRGSSITAASDSRS